MGSIRSEKNLRVESNCLLGVYKGETGPGGAIFSYKLFSNLYFLNCVRITFLQEKQILILKKSGGWENVSRKTVWECIIIPSRHTTTVTPIREAPGGATRPQSHVQPQCVPKCVTTSKRGMCS